MNSLTQSLIIYFKGNPLSQCLNENKYCGYAGMESYECQMCCTADFNITCRADECRFCLYKLPGASELNFAATLCRWYTFAGPCLPSKVCCWAPLDCATCALKLWFMLAQTVLLTLATQLNHPHIYVWEVAAHSDKSPHPDADYSWYYLFATSFALSWAHHECPCGEALKRLHCSLPACRTKASTFVCFCHTQKNWIELS